MHRLSVYSAGLLAAAILLLPTVAFAQVSFGGRVVGISYCLHGAVNITIVPAGGFPISYVWAVPPTTLTVTSPFLPPTHIGQQVIGLALPVPIPCVGFGLHPPIWWGLKVIYGGVSLTL